MIMIVAKETGNIWVLGNGISQMYILTDGIKIKKLRRLGRSRYGKKKRDWRLIQLKNREVM